MCSDMVKCELRVANASCELLIFCELRVALIVRVTSCELNLLCELRVERKVNLSVRRVLYSISVLGHFSVMLQP